MQNTIFIYKGYLIKTNLMSAYLTLLKNTLTIDRQISVNNNKLDRFERCSIVYDQL